MAMNIYPPLFVECDQLLEIQKPRPLKRGVFRPMGLRHKGLKFKDIGRGKKILKRFFIDRKKLRLYQ
jgi:hypothetical protein